jgi:anti-sigma factor RsiW
MIDECAREVDTIDAITSGAWPAACAAELKAHIASCAVCREAAGVAAAIRDDCQSASVEVRVPSAGLVWWRAQLRARHEVAETAGRPITYAQAVAAAVAAALLFVLGGLLWPWLQASFVWIDRVSQAIDLGRFWLPLALMLGASLVLAPLVLFFVLSDD